MSGDGSGPVTPELRRVGSRVGSPSVVAVLAVLVVIGIGVAMVVLLGAVAADARQAERTAAVARVLDGTTAAIAVLELERDSAELYHASGLPAHRSRYTGLFPEVDGRVDAVRALWAGEAAASLVPSQLDLIDEVRTAVLAQDEEGPVTDLYDGLISSLTGAMTQLAGEPRDPGTARGVQALLALTRAADSLSQRRSLLAAVLAGGEGLDDEASARLILLGQQFAANLAAATPALGEQRAAAADALRQSAAAEAASEIVTLSLTGEEGSTVTADGWFEVASAQLAEVNGLIADLAADLAADAEGSLEAARRTGIVTAALLGILLVAGVVAAWGAITASRQRVAALAEHRRLVEGLRSWFVPEAMPVLDGLEVAGRYVPSAEYATAGGDWYDVVDLGEGRAALVVGDVAGHGPEAVAHMAELKHVLRGVMLAGSGESSPAAGVDMLDRVVARPGVLATMLLAVVDTHRPGLTYCRAGHMPGLVRSPQGEVAWLAAASSPPIGAVADVGHREDTRASLEAGSIVVLFTDGLVEAPHRDIDAALAGLADVLATADVTDLGGLADEMIGRRPPRLHGDDVALLVARVGGA